MGLPLVHLTTERRRSIPRTDDRRVTFLGLGVSAAFLAAALLSGLLPEGVRHGLWLPIHLALAGAASTAVAAVLPFFTAALAVAAPVDHRVRLVAILAIAGGAALVTSGLAVGVTWLAVGGGLAYLAGVILVAYVAFTPLRGALGPQRPLITRAYRAALLYVAVGVVLSTAFLAGTPVVVEHWARLKPAHAWLDLVGFLSLVVVATMLHLSPTVVGTRIRPQASARVSVVALAVGAPVTALGLAMANAPLIIVGAIATVVAGIALTVHAASVERERGPWTTDPGWHRFASWSLVLGPIWFAVGVAIALARFVVTGADPSAWDVTLIAPALIVGWIVQVLVGSWTHLLPAIGPGGPVAHGRQRAILGSVATSRVIALDVGVALTTVGILGGAGASWLVGGGLALAALSIAVSIGLAGRAMWVGRAGL